MLSLSTAARLLAGERIVSALKSSSSVVSAAFSALPSARIIASKPLAASSFSAPLSSRGLASRAGSSRTASSKKNKSTSAKRSSSKSKSSKSKSTSAKRSSSATRGTRSAKKNAKSKAVLKKLKQARAARLAQKLKVRKAKEARRQRDIKQRATQKAKVRLAKLKKMRTLMEQRQQKRRTLIAKNQNRRLKQKTIDSKRRLSARVRLLAARRRAVLEKDIAAKLARDRKFAEAHPKLARARAAESRGLPAAPKLPLSAWATFIKANFGSAKAELVSTGTAAPKPTEVLKALAVKYKAVPEEQKAKLAAEQAKRKAEYELQKQQQQAQLPPKRPQSAYLVFFLRRQKEILRANPGLKLGDVSKQVAESWKVLGEAEKATLQADAAKATIAWKDRLAAWADQHPGVPTSPIRIKPTIEAIRLQLKEQQKTRLAKQAASRQNKKKVANKKKA